MVTLDPKKGTPCSGLPFYKHPFFPKNAKKPESFFWLFLQGVIFFKSALPAICLSGRITSAGFNKFMNALAGFMHIFSAAGKRQADIAMTIIGIKIDAGRYGDLFTCQQVFCKNKRIIAKSRNIGIEIKRAIAGGSPLAWQTAALSSKYPCFGHSADNGRSAHLCNQRQRWRPTDWGSGQI